jgi:hypothetical protein
MKRFWKPGILAVTTIALLFIWGCGGDDPVEPDPSSNNPPETPSEPFPEHQAIDQALNVNLAWTCTDPDEGDTLHYSVYFSTATTPELAQGNYDDETYDPGTLDYNTVYYWRIVAYDNHGDSISGPAWSFTTGEFINSPPNAPSNPNPADDAMDVSFEVNLSWQCSDPDAGDVLSYNVYFGTTDPPQLVSQAQSDLSYDPGTLDYSTEYYWQIVAYDNQGDSTVSDLWNFTTGESDNSPPNAPSSPTPANSAINQMPEVDLAWYSSDPDGDAVTYDVYLGTSDNPGIEAEDLSVMDYDPGMLQYSTTYYWKVVAFDINGDSTASPVWNFMTADQSPSEPAIIWYGNADGSPITAPINDRLDVEVFLMTEATTWIGSIQIHLGANRSYIDSLLNDAEAVLHYPFTEWEVTDFLAITGEPYNPSGWFCEPFLGLATIISPDAAWFNSTTPLQVMTLKVKTVNDASLSGRTVAAFGPGFNNQYQNSIAGDTLGYDLSVLEFFSQVHFDQ